MGARAFLLFAALSVAHAIEPCQLLVAARELGDPNFVRTVVLIIGAKSGGVMGLVLNRPMPNTPVSRVFVEGKKIADPIYFGGPVERGGMLALSRNTGAKTVCGDISLISDDKELTKALGSYPGASDMRIYAGYAGWTKSQLDHEIQLGAWHLMRFQTSIVYDTTPSLLWNRLIATTETQLAYTK